MKMAHITIHTDKMEQSVAFYRDMLGMEIKAHFPGAGGKPIVFLGSEESDVRVELIEAPEAAYSGAGLSVGFRAENVEQMREKMQALGLNPTPMIMPNPHTSFFFVKDPNGVSIQFL